MLWNQQSVNRWDFVKFSKPLNGFNPYKRWSILQFHCLTLPHTTFFSLPSRTELKSLSFCFHGELGIHWECDALGVAEVELSCQRYMPTLLPALASVPWSWGMLQIPQMCWDWADEVFLSLMLMGFGFWFRGVHPRTSEDFGEIVGQYLRRWESGSLTSGWSDDFAICQKCLRTYSKGAPGGNTSSR